MKYIRNSFLFYVVGLVVFTLLAVPLRADSISTHFNEPPDPNGLKQAVLNVIQNADTSVDVAIYSFSDDDVANELIDAHDSGVSVRVVTEADNRDKDGIKSTLDNLENNGITVKTDNRSALMHHKFVEADSEVVVAGSTNFRRKQFENDKNNMVTIEDSCVAGMFHAEMDQMWSGNYGSSKTNTYEATCGVDGNNVTVQFSPNANQSQDVINTIQNASQSVGFSIFTFTKQSIADELDSAENAGIDVFGVFDAWKASDGVYTSQRYDELRNDSVPARMDDYDGLVHDKMLVADGLESGGNPAVITGSYNWTNSGDDDNDETLLKIDGSDTLASDYATEAERIWVDYTKTPDTPLERNSTLVNINDDPKSELETLEGIGSSTADDIIDYRQNETFYEREDIMNVSGIGTGTYEDIKDDIATGISIDRINVNTASETLVRDLEGIGTTLAERIVDTRPISSLYNLTEVDGIGESTARDQYAEATVGDLVRINKADTERLKVLDGIGDVLAGRIIEYRNDTSTYDVIEDLTNVDGIGTTTVEDNRGIMTADNPVDINEDPSEKLQWLWGVGSTYAQNIIDYRDTNGDFASPEDIKKVDGIDDTKFAENEDIIIVPSSN